jgi:hypothetical protein
MASQPEQVGESRQFQATLDQLFNQDIDNVG